MLEDLESVPWRSLEQPSWNREDAVPAALRELGLCASESESHAVYHKVLYTLGNNHAGSYYPVVLAALPFLVEILQFGGQWARIITLDILIDLSASFEPESGFELVASPTGQQLQLRVLVQEEVARLAPRVRSIAASATAAPRERELAAELLRCLEAIEDG